MKINPQKKKPKHTFSIIECPSVKIRSRNLADGHSMKIGSLENFRLYGSVKVLLINCGGLVSDLSSTQDVRILKRNTIRHEYEALLRAAQLESILALLGNLKHIL